MYQQLHKNSKEKLCRINVFLAKYPMHPPKRASSYTYAYWFIRCDCLWQCARVNSEICDVVAHVFNTRSTS